MPEVIRRVGLVVLLLLAACAPRRIPPERAPSPAGAMQEGKASWYGGRFNGRKTASGEIFDDRLMTAAHKTLTFGTEVRVTNLNNGKQVVVRINDRGPYSPGRIIDLSRGAAERLDMIRSGVVPVRLEVTRPGKRRR
jgi:rare lipoprotein A